MNGRSAMIVARGVMTKVDDGTGLQSVQIELLADEAHDGAERFQDYGLTSVPHHDAEVIAVFPGGVRGHAIIVAIADRRYRLTGLAEGEVALHDDQGQKVHLKRDGIEITSPFKVTIDAPTTVIESDQVTVHASTATIDAGTVNLGGTGGAGVARIGDHVVGGVITEGSSKVKAA